MLPAQVLWQSTPAPHGRPSAGVAREPAFSLKSCGLCVQIRIFCVAEQGGDWGHGKCWGRGSGAAHICSMWRVDGPQLCPVSFLQMEHPTSEQHCLRMVPGAKVQWEWAGQGKQSEAASELKLH